MKQKRKEWWVKGGLGSVFFGSGLSIAIESSHIKHSMAEDYIWILGGTAGIGLALVGIFLLIQAGILQRELDKD